SGGAGSVRAGEGGEIATVRRATGGCLLRGEVAEITAEVAAGPFTPTVRARAGPPAEPPAAPPD
ncbi:helicase, partial [Streptomyces sp. BF23-19]